jgi:hypothetical protein
VENTVESKEDDSSSMIKVGRWPGSQQLELEQLLKTAMMPLTVSGILPKAARWCRQTPSCEKNEFKLVSMVDYIRRKEYPPLSVRCQ